MFTTSTVFAPRRNPLAGLPCLKSRVAIYIPTTLHDLPAPADVIDAHRENAARLLSDLFGGYTEVGGSGGWWSDRLGRLIREPVWICYAGCTPEQVEQHLAAVIDFAGSLAVAMDQEAVTVEVNGSIYFVPQTADAVLPTATAADADAVLA